MRRSTLELVLRRLGFGDHNEMAGHIEPSIFDSDIAIAAGGRLFSIARERIAA